VHLSGPDGIFQKKDRYDDDLVVGFLILFFRLIPKIAFNETDNALDNSGKI